MHWLELNRGNGVAVHVVGEAGIGKSQLLRRFIELESINRSDYLLVRGQDETKRSFLKPIIDTLQKAWQLDNIDAGEAFEILTRELKSPNTGDVELIAELLGVPLPQQAEVPRLTPQIRRHRVLNLLADYFTGSSSISGRIVFFEDLHWFDSTTVELVSMMVPRVRNKAVLLLFSSRPEFAQPWALEDVINLTLLPLSRDEVVNLIKSVSNARSVPDDLVDRILERAEGVPLFLEELTKTAFDSNAISIDASGNVYVSGKMDNSVIPVSIYGCLMTRLDSMQQAKELAQLGAIIGARFPHALLKFASSFDDELISDCIQKLIDADVISAKGNGDNQVYEYKHALLRDAIIRSLLRDKRKELHSVVCDTLAEKFPDRLVQEPEVMAYHLSEGGRARESVDYWQQAGLEALANFANVDAISYFSSALDQLDSIEDSSEKTSLSLSLTVLKATPLMVTKGWGAKEVRSCYLIARDLLDQVENRVSPELFPTLVGLASYFIVTADWAEAERLTSQNVELAEQIGDKELLFEAESERVVVHAYSGDPDKAISSLANALNCYEPEKCKDHLPHYGRNGIVVAYTANALNLWALGKVDTAVDNAKMAMKEARRNFHPFSVAWSYSPITLVYLLREQPEHAERLIDEFCVFAEQHGFPYWLGQGLVCRGWKETFSGNLEAAERDLKTGLEIWYQGGTRMLDPMMTFPLIRLKLLQGKLTEALDRIERSLQFINESGECWFEPEIELIKGQVYEAMEGPNNELALSAYYRALELAVARRAGTMQIRSATEIARILGNCHKHDEGVSLLRPLVDGFIEGKDSPHMVKAQQVLASLVSF